MCCIFPKRTAFIIKVYWPEFLHFLETVQHRRETQGICAKQVTVVVQREDLYTRKGKVHLETVHEGPQRVQRYSFTLSLILALHGGGVVNAAPQAGLDLVQSCAAYRRFGQLRTAYTTVVPYNILYNYIL